MANSCLNCKFADWQRTATGRLHPSGGGRCGWRMAEIVLPKAFYWVGFSNTPMRPSGGYIDRGNPNVDCPTWEAQP